MVSDYWFSGDVVTKIEKGTTHNITLYAKWERLYQLSYDANGGTMPDNYDTSYYLGEGKVLPIPTKMVIFLKAGARALIIQFVYILPFQLVMKKI